MGLFPVVLWVYSAHQEPVRAFALFLWLLPALASPHAVHVSVCQEPPVPLPARVTPHLLSLCQTQCWLLGEHSHGVTQTALQHPWSCPPFLS